jgi:hypothetical protein
MGQVILVFGGITMLIAFCEKLISPVTRRLNLHEVVSIALATIIVIAGIVGYGYFSSTSEAQSKGSSTAQSSATPR